MRLASMTLALTCCLVSTVLLAGEAVATSTPFSKRMLSDCMSKRMYSDRTLSYNDASKACKDQLRGNKTDAALSSATTPKPVG